MTAAEVIIIGGGVAGLTLAAELAPVRRVLVLEAEAQPGHHASGRSAALYEPGYGPPAIQALTEASLPAYQAAGLLSPRGVMLLGREDEREAFHREAEEMHLAPVALEEVFARVPLLRRDRIAYAAQSEAAQDIDTDLLMQNALRRLRQAGGELRCGQRLREIRREGAEWILQAAETFRAPVIVNAAGAWAGEIAAMAGLRGPVFQPYRRSMARIALPEGMNPAAWPMLLGVGEAWYAKPDAGALIVSPGEADPMPPHDASADDMVLAEGLARYEDNVTVPVTRLLANWAGLRTFAPDKLMVIGPDPVEPSFHWQAGQGGYGFQTAPAAAALGADLLLGRAPRLGADLVAALSPRRFLTRPVSTVTAS